MAAQSDDGVRPVAKFPPSIWGDRFLNYNINDMEAHERVQKQIEELKEVVRREVFATTHDPSQQLKLIDAVERLGLSYHFENELQETLQHMFETYEDQNYKDEDLYHVALRFRLLRQNGYHISSDMFNNFKDESGSFKECLVVDVPGMLSLYEAAHLIIHGEDILDEALNFTTTHLKTMANSLTLSNNPLAAQVTNALYQPLQRTPERIKARHYISTYKDDVSHYKALLELAKLDFNIVQSKHRMELSEISRWWKEIDVPRRLPFARDRIVELYFWIVGIYFEPTYHDARIFLTKVLGLISILDDIYDAFGIFEELELFTEAIARWNVSCMDQLPEYMKICYQALLDLFEECDEDMEDERKYRFDYAKESMKIIVRSYFDQAKWLKQGYIPTVEEYFRVALISSTHMALSTVSFVGMRDVTKDAFEWILTRPKMLVASEEIGRIMNDLASHKFEHERNHIATGIECYMKQHGVLEQVAYNELKMVVVNAWKDINEALLRPTVMPVPVLKRILNLSRINDFFYQEDDHYTRVEKATKDAITAVFIDPV